MVKIACQVAMNNLIGLFLGECLIGMPSLPILNLEEFG